MHHILQISFLTIILGTFSWGQDSKIQLELKDLKIGPFGYKILSTDFETDPQRQIVTTLSAAGEVIDIRGRFTVEKNIEEWSVFYNEGVPALAQLKKWQKISLDDEELGEALVGIETFLAKDGKFATEKKAFRVRLKDLQTFATNSKQPINAPEAKPQGNLKRKSSNLSVSTPFSQKAPSSQEARISFDDALFLAGPTPRDWTLTYKDYENIERLKKDFIKGFEGNTIKSYTLYMLKRDAKLIGASLKTLEVALATKSVQKGPKHIFTFDSGLGWSEWHFEVLDDKIISCKNHPFE